MLPSDAVSTASGSPRSARSSNWRTMSRRMMPWRRWVGMTPTHVTPAVGTAAPPGTVMANEKALVDPTTSAPSTATRVRSSSRMPRTKS